jgi:hypothetical protein
LSVLRAEAKDEVEEDHLTKDEPEADEGADQQDEVVDVIRVGGKRLDVSIDHRSSLENEEEDSCDEQAHANHRDQERLTNQLFRAVILTHTDIPSP